MKKVKNSILFALIGIFSIAVSFQGNAQNKLSNSLLWKIEGNGIQPSYLMGTFHILPKEDFELKDKVKTAFKDADQVVLELDMDDPAMQTEMIQNMMLKDGKTLKDFVTEEEYKILDKALLQAAGQGMNVLGRMKPILLTSIITTDLMGEQPASFELTFIKMATEQKKEILGLETVAEQVAVFDDISYESQLDDLVEMISNKEETSDLFSSMIDSYKKEDLAAMVDLINEQMDEPEDVAKMLDNRNKKWIPKIGELSAEKSTFYGVGAGHLAGENGVINLLKKAGYTLTPIK